MLDYGIGNLRSAQKALEGGGRCATDHRPRPRSPTPPVVLPGVGAFGACMDALRRRARASPTRRSRGRPFLGICVGMQMLFAGSEENPAAPGSACCRARSAGPGRRETAADAMELLEVTRPSSDFAGLATSRGCTSCTRSRRARRPARRRRRVTTAARSRRRSARATCSPRSSTRRSPANRAPDARQLRRGWWRRCPLMELFPAIDLRGGRCVRCTRATTTARRSTARTRSTWRGFDAAGAHGSTSSISTRPQGEPVNRRSIAANAAARPTAEVQAGGGVPRRRRRGARRRRCGPGRDGYGRHAPIPSWWLSSPHLMPSPSGSITATGARRGRLDRRQPAVGARTGLDRYPAAFGVHDHRHLA